MGDPEGGQLTAIIVQHDQLSWGGGGGVPYFSLVKDTLMDKKIKAIMNVMLALEA